MTADALGKYAQVSTVSSDAGSVATPVSKGERTIQAADVLLGLGYATAGALLLAGAGAAIVGSGWIAIAAGASLLAIGVFRLLAHCFNPKRFSSSGMIAAGLVVAIVSGGALPLLITGIALACMGVLRKVPYAEGLVCFWGHYLKHQSAVTATVAPKPVGSRAVDESEFVHTSEEDFIKLRSSPSPKTRPPVEDDSAPLMSTAPPSPTSTVRSPAIEVLPLPGSPGENAVPMTGAALPPSPKPSTGQAAAVVVDVLSVAPPVVPLKPATGAALPQAAVLPAQPENVFSTTKRFQDVSYLVTTAADEGVSVLIGKRSELEALGKSLEESMHPLELLGAVFTSPLLRSKMKKIKESITRLVPEPLDPGKRKLAEWKSKQTEGLKACDKRTLQFYLESFLSSLEDSLSTAGRKLTPAQARQLRGFVQKCDGASLIDKLIELIPEKAG